jgi:hypothetical protein
VLADQLRLEGSLAVARHVNAQRAVVGQDSLAAAAIAMVGNAYRFLFAARLAKVMRHFGTQCPSDDGFLELPHDGFDRLGRHGASDELIDQFLGDGWQCGVNCADVFLLAWWHTWSFLGLTYYALHTEFLTPSPFQDAATPNQSESPPPHSSFR